MDTYADSELSLPNSYYDGLTLCIDLEQLTSQPPDLLKDTGITGEMLLQKCCLSDDPTGVSEITPINSAKGMSHICDPRLSLFLSSFDTSC